MVSIIPLLPWAYREEMVENSKFITKRVAGFLGAQRFAKTNTGRPRSSRVSRQATGSFSGWSTQPKSSGCWKDYSTKTSSCPRTVCAPRLCSILTTPTSSKPATYAPRSTTTSRPSTPLPCSAGTPTGAPRVVPAQLPADNCPGAIPPVFSANSWRSSTQLVPGRRCRLTR